jgi:hypothetical protein
MFQIVFRIYSLFLRIPSRLFSSLVFHGNAAARMLRGQPRAQSMTRASR